MKISFKHLYSLYTYILICEKFGISDIFIFQLQDYDDEYLLNKIYDDVNDIYDDILGNAESDKPTINDEGNKTKMMKMIN